MRFAANTVHDIRGAAVKCASSMPANERKASGDVISRIIGDSARIKAGVSGILVHGIQNGLLFITVCAVMFYIKPSLGLIFFVAGLVALFIGLKASSPVASSAIKQRRKEGNYAVVLQEGLDYGNLSIDNEDMNASSARKEVRTTRLIALSSLYVHIVLAVAVGLALWVGSNGVKAGTIAPGELFLFIAYALTVHRRMVQVGRQSARSGKVLASTERLAFFLKKNSGNADAPVGFDQVLRLTTGITLDRVKIFSDRGSDARPRLRRTALSVKAGSKVAVLGRVGSGKTTLLKVIAGIEVPDKGRVLWDGTDVTDGDRLARSVAFLAHDPVFPSTHIWKILRLAGPDSVTDEAEELLKLLKVRSIINGFPKKFAEKVDSMSLSRNEARILQLAGFLIGGNADVWALDSPVQGFTRKKGISLLKEMIARAEGRTVLVALSEPIGMTAF